jgi:uncharacterized damage-inducible protein DinB
MKPAAPTAVLSSRLAAAPAAVWAQLTEGDFVARYLGVPAAALTVTESVPPAALALRLQRGGEAAQVVRWTIAACAGGSRLTVVHEAAAAGTAFDAVASRLAAALPAVLAAPRVAGAAALQAACVHLQGCSAAVAALAAALPDTRAYRQPAGGGFSLAEHLWHLADIEAFGWRPRFERVLAEAHPRLPGVDGDRLAVERRYQQRPWRGAARRFIAQRRRTLAVLARLAPTALDDTVHFAGADCSVGDLLAALLAHDQEHRLAMASLWTTTQEAA